MKTKILFAAALLVTGTAFSQTVSSRNEASSRTSTSASSSSAQASAGGSLSSSSSASGSVNPAKKVEAASQATSGVKQSAEANVGATKTEVKNNYQQVRQESEAEHRTSASVNAGSNGNVETQHNKAGSNASINTRSGVSTGSTVESANMKMAKAEVKVKKAADATSKSGNSLKTRTKAAAGKPQVNTGSKASVNGGARHAGIKTGVKSNTSGHSGLYIK